jgi:hypothetical protein
VCCRFLSEFSLLQVPRPAVVRATQLGLTMAKKKRQAQRAAVKQPAPKKRQRGRAKASASADAEQGSSTQPKKKSRAGPREPSSSHYSVLNKRTYVASQPTTACTPFIEDLSSFVKRCGTTVPQRLTKLDKSSMKGVQAVADFVRLRDRSAHNHIRLACLQATHQKTTSPSPIRAFPPSISTSTTIYTASSRAASSPVTSVRRRALHT